MVKLASNSDATCNYHQEEKANLPEKRDFLEPLGRCVRNESRVWLRRACLRSMQPPELRHIAAPLEVYPNRVIHAFILIILCKSLADFGCRAANHMVCCGVIVGWPAKDFHPNLTLLQV